MPPPAPARSFQQLDMAEPSARRIQHDLHLEAEIAGPATQAEALLKRYRRYLLAERGLREKVARGYADSVRPSVAGCAAAGDADLRCLTAGDVTAARSPSPGRGTAATGFHCPPT